MKHVLLNQYGQEHAHIIACPFKYTLPRGFTVHEDNPVMGKLAVDTFHHMQPKPKDDVDAHAMDFAVCRNGIVESVVQWGGAEWCPPAGTTLLPIDQFIGIGDTFDHVNHKFAIHENRLGINDKDKSVAQLEMESHGYNN